MERRFRKEGLVEKESKDWIRREYEDPDYDSKLADTEAKLRKLQNQERVLKIFTVAFIVLIVFTLAIIALQGFHVAGFVLSVSTINILAGSVILEILGLIAIAYRWLYK